MRFKRIVFIDDLKRPQQCGLWNSFLQLNTFVQYFYKPQDSGRLFAEILKK